jgi:hypothetical protein
MKVFSPTLEEFEKQCNELMDTLIGDPATFEERVLAMSMDEFKQVRSNSHLYSSAGYATLRKLAEFLRNGFNPYAQGVKISDDPLRTILTMDIYRGYSIVINKVYQERYADIPAIQAKNVEYRAHEQAIALERKLTICIDGITYKAEKVIEVLWAGWECDSEAWLIKDGDTYKVATTDHGSHYFADKDFLMEKIAEYEKALRETKEFLVWIS